MGVSRNHQNIMDTKDSTVAEEFTASEVDAGQSGPLLIGFDFGTSWTAVATNRGHKELIRSVVGYPKDMIGIKLLGEPFVVGEKAFEMRSYVDLRSPLKDGVLREYIERDVEVARHFVGHVIANLMPDGNEEVCVMVGVPARASNTRKDLMLKVFKEFTDVAQVISEPFLAAYSQGTLVNCIVIDIGAGTVDVCALKGAMPGERSQVTVNRAGNFVNEKQEELIVETYPNVQMNPYIVTKLKEEHSYVGQPTEQIIVDLRADGKPVSYDITEAIGAACEVLLPGITEGVERLIQTVSPEDQETMLQNIYVAGGGSRIRGIDQYIADALADYGDVGVTCVTDPTFAVATGALKLASELPPQYWEQLGSVTDY